MLLQFLQPIFLLSFLFLCFPGRDTQDAYFNDEGMHTAFLASVLLPSVRLLLDFFVLLLCSSATFLFSLVLVVLGCFWLTAIPSNARYFELSFSRVRAPRALKNLQAQSTIMSTDARFSLTGLPIAYTLCSTKPTHPTCYILTP